MELINNIYNERFFNKNTNKKRYYAYLMNICKFYSLKEIKYYKYYDEYLNEKYKEYLYKPYIENDWIKEELIIWRNHVGINSSATSVINYFKPKYYEEDRITKIKI